MVVLEIWGPQDSSLFPLFCLSSHPPCCVWGQNKHGSSSRQVCNSSSCFELFKYCPTFDMGIFKWVAIYSHSLTYEALLSFPCWCMNKGIWPLCHLICLPQWNKKSWNAAWKFLNTQIKCFMNKCSSYILFIRISRGANTFWHTWFVKNNYFFMRDF